MFIVLRSFFRKIVYTPSIALKLIVLLFMVFLYGTTGFVYFEMEENPDITFVDGFWYSIVTMATVGYGDLFPKTTPGRLLIGVPLMLLGIGLLGYTLSIVATVLITEKNKEIKGMSNINLKDHLVIINYPSLSKIALIITELKNDPAFREDSFVAIIDEDLEELPPELSSGGIRFIRGNPTRDETLTRASIDYARHVVVLCKNPGNPASDNLNVAITLAVEGRTGAASKRIKTVVECVNPYTEALLRKAKCDHVVCLSRFDAYFVSQELLNPGTQEVIFELIDSSKGEQLYFTPIACKEGDTFSTLKAAASGFNHIVLGLRRQHSDFILNPPPETLLNNNDTAITIGPKRIDKFSVG
ncbi:MAG: NAD-binding protein [Nitrospirae bacterium]|nr:NAD-binding protein [Nitrospirota bacterium]